MISMRSLRSSSLICAQRRARSSGGNVASENTVVEIASQPQIWERALTLDLAGLTQHGERVAVVGCGTSWSMPQSYATLREQAGKGVTDAFTATEMPTSREYDRILTISRSGTTSEIIALLSATSTPATLITAVAGGPAAAHADHEIVL